MESFMSSRSMGEESLQMWGLNKRLEAYLARVKSLEEENGLLRSEIQSLKAGSPEGSCWRGHYEEELASLRATLDQAFREKHVAELARLALSDQVQEVTSQCQKERAAREEAKRALAVGKKALEEERRAQLWLREKAAQLEKEAEGLAEAHREELAGLEQEAAGFPRTLGVFQGVTPGCPQPLEVEDYAQRLSAIWQGAVETYKCGVSQAEASLSQAKEELRRAVQGNRQSRLQLQQMETEMAGLQSRKEALEESLSHQGQLQQGEAEKLQLAVESLEEEKRSLRSQIAQVLEDRQQLAHLKMSLSLEVATYRTLLEAESTRLQMPTAVDFKLPSSLKDLRAEVNGSKPQAAMSRERGHLDSQDPWPSPAAFLRGSTRLWSPRSPGKPSLASSPASLLPKTRSPVAREFQKAKTVLQSQSAKGFDLALTQEEAPVLVESTAFQLGASQQSQVVTATRIESVSQSFFRESPPVSDSISPIIPNILEESSPKEKGQEGGGEKTGTHMEKVEGIMEKEDDSEVAREEEEEEVEEEEERYPSGRPPGETPSQLITEALAIATKDMKSTDTPPESSLLIMMETQNGFPSNDSSSLEEENEATPAPSRKGLEGMEELHKDLKRNSQPAEWPENIEGFEASVEVNGGQEAHAECQEEEGGLWVSGDPEPPSLLESGLSEEKGIREQIAMDIPVTEGMEIYKETKYPEQNKSDDGGQPPAFLLDEPEVASECPAPAHHVGKEALADKESWEAGAGHCQDPAGATGGCWEEAEGGTEDLEVVSTEALHFSEDEERRELWSPSRENEECDLQEKMPRSEFRTEDGGPATGSLSPLSHTALPLERCQEDLFLLVEQEKPEEEKRPLCQTDSSLPEEEAEEVALEPEAFSVEETLLGSVYSARNEENTLPGEPGVTDSREAEEEEGKEGIALPRDLQEEENDLENEDFSGMEAVSLQEAALEHQEVENVVLEQEISTGEQVEGALEASPQQLQMEQEMEEEEIPMASPEAEDCALEGAKMLKDPKATEAEKEEEGKAGQVSPCLHLEEKDGPPEGSEAQQAMAEGQGAANEQQVITGKDEETDQSQQGTALGQSTTLDASQETEAPSEVQRDTLSGSEDTGHTDASEPQSQNDSLESEESLESPDTSPNATCKGEGIGKELESGQEIMLEETLPDHTPLCAYLAETLATTTESQRLPEDEDAARDGYEFLKEETEQVLEDGGPSSPPPREKDKEQEGFKEEESCPVESEETPAAKDMEETKTERPEPLQEENQDPHIAKPELSRAEEHFALYPEPLEAESEKEAEGSSPQQGGDVEKEPELAEQTPEGKAGADFAWKPEQDSVFQAGSFDPGSLEESVPAEDGGSLELSDQEEVEAEGPHKDSPLTSVADLGEIVLEEEEPLGFQRAMEADPKDLTCTEIVLPGAPEPCQTSKLESHGREEEPQEEDPAELGPRAKGFPDPSPEVTMSSSLDGMKDSDILEIVEQALEFNQELIKAAEQSTEVGPPSAGEEAPLSPEEKSPDVSATSLDRDVPQIVKEVPEVSSSSAKDPAGPPPSVDQKHHKWASGRSQHCGFCWGDAEWPWASPSQDHGEGRQHFCRRTGQEDLNL
ncbi:nestin [Sceloporus undulatus]|uniref:nestin n=1 Tax=Sceloporus undulatus TaxID=8520 RepID=UPI001C4D5717|nr:nestin [Sceloporus undulatus]